MRQLRSAGARPRRDRRPATSAALLSDVSRHAAAGCHSTVTKQRPSFRRKRFCTTCSCSPTHTPAANATPALDAPPTPMAQSEDGNSFAGPPNPQTTARQAARLQGLVSLAHEQYCAGRYTETLATCESVYQADAHRTDNLLLLGAASFQLRAFSECIFYNQQCIRIDPNFAEAYSNLGNALKELSDVQGAIQFYLKAIKLKPRFCDAYNNLASAHMQLGQTDEAIQTYQMALVLSPGLVDAHCNLGNLHKAKGQLELARHCYLEAIRLKPEFAIAWSNLAGVYKEEGQLATAAAYYREAIKICPQFADAHSNLGNALKEQGALDEAIVCYKTAIRHRPDFAIAHGNLASCYYDKRDLELAIKTFKYAIQLEPNFPDAYNNLGNAMREVGRLAESVECYRAALRLKPDHPHAYNNLGNAMKDQGLVKEAIHCYVTATRLMPSFAAAHSNLGSILKEQGSHQQAIAHYHQAVTIDPTFADAYCNMGSAYKALGRIPDAIKCYHTAIKINPTFAHAYSNLASAYKDSGHHQEAIKCYRKALSLSADLPDAAANLSHTLGTVCDWSDRDRDVARLVALVDAQLAADAAQGVLPCVQPFHTLGVDEIGPRMQKDVATRYAGRVAKNVALARLNAPPQPPLGGGMAGAATAVLGARHGPIVRAPGERIHVGYVSSDFGNHPLSHLMQSVFGMHDRDRFCVTCYSLSSQDGSAARRKIETEAERFVDVSKLSNADAAALIRSDGVHVLVNLNGYTKGARNEIFALEPAPVQVAYLGFCGTLGAEYVHYMVADEVVVPEASQDLYTEKMLYLPHSYLVNDHAQAHTDVRDEPDLLPTRGDYGVPEDKFVFANFGQLHKVAPSTFDVWMSILKRVPNSILWLLRFPPVAEENLRREARARGVRDDQLHFTDVAPKDEHIKRGHLCDLFLDTPGCNAQTTGCDILWSGTPMVSLKAEKMAARVGASLLAAVGCAELATDTLEAYEELAVTLAVDADRYFALRTRLEDSRAPGRDFAPLFDTMRWVRNYEAGLEAVVATSEAGEAPDVVRVADCLSGDDGKTLEWLEKERAEYRAAQEQ